MLRKISLRRCSAVGPFFRFQSVPRIQKPSFIQRPSLGLLFVWASFLTTGGSAQCEAQNRGLASIERSGGITLLGLSHNEVESRLGPPDRKSARTLGSTGTLTAGAVAPGPVDKAAELRGSKESWHYGPGIVLFADGKVTAMLNPADLQRRARLTRLLRSPQAQARDKEQRASLGYGVDWLNPWTPRAKVTVQDAIEDVVTSP